MEDLIGKKFNRLTVLSYYGLNKHGQRLWNCSCECGNNTITKTADLKSGKTKSCGCALKGVNTRHGMCGTRLHSIHRDMLARCYNPNRKRYKYYGGRGIFVCEEWLGENGLVNFAKWSFQNGYEEHLTLDRIDNDKEYSPQNCRWATREQQGNNTRRNIYITLDGETHTLAEWCKIRQLNYPIIYQRIHKLKWSYEKALGGN